MRNVVLVYAFTLRPARAQNISKGVQDSSTPLTLWVPASVFPKGFDVARARFVGTLRLFNGCAVQVYDSESGAMKTLRVAPGTLSFRVPSDASGLWINVYRKTLPVSKGFGDAPFRFAILAVPPLVASSREPAAASTPFLLLTSPFFILSKQPEKPGSSSYVFGGRGAARGSARGSAHGSVHEYPDLPPTPIAPSLAASYAARAAAEAASSSMDVLLDAIFGMASCGDSDCGSGKTLAVTAAHSSEPAPAPDSRHALGGAKRQRAVRGQNATTTEDDAWKPVKNHHAKKQRSARNARATNAHTSFVARAESAEGGEGGGEGEDQGRVDEVGIRGGEGDMPRLSLEPLSMMPEQEREEPLAPCSPLNMRQQSTSPHPHDKDEHEHGDDVLRDESRRMPVGADASSPVRASASSSYAAFLQFAGFVPLHSVHEDA